MGFFQNVNVYKVGECKISTDGKHLYMYEKTGWREVATTRRKNEWIDAVNSVRYTKSKHGFWAVAKRPRPFTTIIGTIMGM